MEGNAVVYAFGAEFRRVENREFLGKPAVVGKRSNRTGIMCRATAGSIVEL